VTTAVTAPTSSSTTGTTTSSSSTTTKGGLGKDDFLKLLVAQLKYQNPLQPTDPSTFMAQTAQFSMVEKLEQMATDTTNLLTEQRWTSATSMLGKTITWTTTDDAGNSTTKTGVVTGAKAGTGTTAPTLLVGDKEVPSTSVTSVTTATAPTSAS
jgi:flagellar basal-body rod modification protein FlgD